MTLVEKAGEIDAGTVYRVSASQPKGAAALREAGVAYPCLVHTREAVDFRLAGDSDEATRTRVCAVAVRGKNTILYDPSKLMPESDIGERMATAHKEGKFLELGNGMYSLIEEFAQKQERDAPENRDAIILPEQGDQELFQQAPVTRFLLGEGTDRYFDEKVKPSGDSSILLRDFFADSRDTDVPIVNCAEFSGPQAVRK